MATKPADSLVICRITPGKSHSRQTQQWHKHSRQKTTIAPDDVSIIGRILIGLRRHQDRITSLRSVFEKLWPPLCRNSEDIRSWKASRSCWQQDHARSVSAEPPTHRCYIKAFKANASVSQKSSEFSCGKPCLAASTG